MLAPIVVIVVVVAFPVARRLRPARCRLRPARRLRLRRSPVVRRTPLIRPRMWPPPARDKASATRFADLSSAPAAAPAFVSLPLPPLCR
jgi:hypothetical protein